MTTVIPEPADQIRHRKRPRLSRGRPGDFDAQDDRGRNVVQRAFDEVEHRRGVATRFDRTLTHRGGMVLASIVLRRQA